MSQHFPHPSPSDTSSLRPANHLAQMIPISPQQVWSVLTESQQRLLTRALVHIGCRLVTATTSNKDGDHTEVNDDES